MLKSFNALMKAFLPILVLTLILPAAAMASAEGKKALMIVAKRDFEQTEYGKTRKMLEKAGIKVTIASTKEGTLSGNKGKRIKSEILLQDVVVADYDAVVVIGGNGIKKEWKNEDAHRILKEAKEQGKLIAAICAAPGVLAYAGVLEGKKATAHPRSGAKRVMKDRGCQYTGMSLEQDELLITANGPSAADKFGKAIAEALQ